MTDDSRREFLKLAAAASGLVVLGRCSWPVDAAQSVKGGTVDAAGRATVPPSIAPELATVGGAALVTIASVPTPVLLIRHGESAYAAVSGICTHLACPLGYVADKQIVQCPCHGSQFQLDGTVTHLPATKPILAYPTTLDAATGNVIINIRGGDPRLSPVVSGAIKLDLNLVTELTAVGASLTYQPQGLAAPIIIVRVTDTGFAVLDDTCTYQPCLLAFDATANALNCPCHGDSFDLVGEVLTGPATTPLATYISALDGTLEFLTIQVPRS
jgi:Rieske Fe-S protein